MIDINRINAAASVLRSVAIDRGAASLVVLAVVAAVWLLIRRRASAHLASWLWLLPLVPLAIPVERWVPTIDGGETRRVIHAWVGGAPAPAAAVTSDNEASDKDASGSGVSGIVAADRARPGVRARIVARTPTTQAAFMAGPGEHSATRLTLVAWLALVWAAVTLALLTLFVVNQIRTARLVARAPLLDDDTPTARMLRRLVRQTGGRTDVRLRVTRRLASPATWGLMRPTILLPEALSTRLAPTQLRWVLLHELAHVRRADLAVAAVQRVIQIGWWFNPLVWIVNGIVAHWRECACDDAASAACPPRTRTACAAAFLEVVAASSGAARTVPIGVAPLVDGKAQIRRRLMRLMDKKRRVMTGMSPAGMLMLIASAIAGFGVASAQEREPKKLRVPADAPATPQVKDQLDHAVLWLCRKQETEGNWRASTDPEARACGYHNHVHVTAVAVLALLERQRTKSTTEAYIAIQRGLRWLAAQQGDDGAIGPEIKCTRMAGHLMAMLAFCKRQEAEPTRAMLRVIQRGVDFLMRAQNPRAGWRYGVKPGDNDAQITSLALMVLHAASKLGIDVSAERLEWGYGFLTSVADEKTGRVGLLEKGRTGGRLWQLVERFPPERSEEITALGLLAWQADGRDPATDRRMARAIRVVTAMPPAWQAGSVDYMYWTFGTLALQGIGGYQRRAWNAALEKALAPQFDAEGGECWPATDAWCLPGMQVYPTAMALWALSAAREG